MLAPGGVEVLYLAAFVFALAATFGDLLLALARGAATDEFGWLKKRFEKRLWSVGPPLALLAVVLLTLAVT